MSNFQLIHIPDLSTSPLKQGVHEDCWILIRQQTTMSDSFESFRAALKGDIVTPSDEGYEKAIARWAINAQRNAKIVAFVKDAQDVSLAIKYAKASQLPIAIRGGGHNPAGASSSENGLVIDLSRYLNGVEVDVEKKLSRIGGGALWETVDKTAIQHGLATVGGTVNHVSLLSPVATFNPDGCLS